MGEQKVIPDYRRLEKNLCDSIHEIQVKLGFAKESIGLYYMKPSIQQLLGVGEVEQEEFLQLLKGFVEETSSRLGKIKITGSEGRYCFQIPVEGVCFIHQSYKENIFLKTLVEVVQAPGCTIEKVLKVFSLLSPDIICETPKGAEFDYVVYAADPTIDEYRYCFSISEMGAYYHRFTKEDYETVL